MLGKLLKNDSRMMKLLPVLVTVMLVGLSLSPIVEGVRSEDISTQEKITGEDLCSDSEIKEKTLYLHNQTTVINEEEVKTMNTTMGEDREITEWDDEETIYFDWYLSPSFAGDFILNGSITMDIWIQLTDIEGHRNEVDLTMNLFEVGPDGEVFDEPIAVGFEEYENVRTVFDEYSISAEADEHLLSAESSLKVEITIRTPGDAVPKRIGFGDPGYPSRLSLETSTYIQIENMKVLDSDFNETYDFSFEEDKTVHFNASVVNPFGGYDINRVNVTLVGPEGSVFYRIPMERVTGDNYSYRSNYTYQWNYSGQPEGEYTVIISAVDNTGYHHRYPDNPGDETYGGHIEKEERGFWIGAERYYVHFKTVDSSENILEDAHVSVYTEGEDDEYITSNFTDQEGVAKVLLREGSYTVRVYWQDVSVKETVYTVNEEIEYENAVELKCTVYEITYVVRDGRDEYVDNANIFLTHPNGTLIRAITDEEGRAEKNQMAGGEYVIRVEWLGREVKATDHHLDSDELLILDARIYYFDIQTVDEDGIPLSDVHASARFDDTHMLAQARLSDKEGTLTMKLPGTTEDYAYDLNFIWRGVEVGSMTSEPLEENRDILVELEVFYIDFYTFDDEGEGLEEAEVQAYNIETGRFANSGITDENGRLTLRLPRGDHEISVDWYGIKVAELTETMTTDMDIIDINCSVFHVEFEMVDNRGGSLENSYVTASHPSGLLISEQSDRQGYANMRLPAAEIDIEVEWKDIVVYSESVHISSGDPIRLDSHVYYLNIDVEDSEGEPLGPVNVKLNYEDGQRLYNSGYTDEYGEMEVRIPIGIWDIEIKYLQSIVYQGQHEVTSEENSWRLDLQTDVYYLIVITEDKEGENLEDVLITVKTEDRQWSGYTTEGGFTIRLPGRDNYLIEAYFKTTDHLTDVELYEETNITLRESTEETIIFDDYPMPIYRTNLFFIVLIIILLITSILFTYKKIGYGNDMHEDVPMEEEYSDEDHHEEEWDDDLEEEYSDEDHHEEEWDDDLEEEWDDDIPSEENEDEKI